MRASKGKNEEIFASSGTAQLGNANKRSLRPFAPQCVTAQWILGLPSHRPSEIDAFTQPGSFADVQWRGDSRSRSHRRRKSGTGTKADIASPQKICHFLRLYDVQFSFFAGVIARSGSPFCNATSRLGHAKRQHIGKNRVCECSCLCCLLFSSGEPIFPSAVSEKA